MRDLPCLEEQYCLVSFSAAIVVRWLPQRKSSECGQASLSNLSNKIVVRKIILDVFSLVFLWLHRAWFNFHDNVQKRFYSMTKIYHVCIADIRRLQGVNFVVVKTLFSESSEQWTSTAKCGKCCTGVVIIYYWFPVIQNYHWSHKGELLNVIEIA